MARIVASEKRIASRHGGVMSSWWVTRHGMTTTAEPRWRKLASEISVVRTGAGGDKAFEACIRLSQRGWAGADAKKRASGFVQTCSFGRNPRAALSKTLASAARHMRKRSGAFARYR